MAFNIPDGAITVKFAYNGIQGTFRIWPVYKPSGSMTKDKSWQWAALGNNGEAATYETALSEARQWICDSIIKTYKET